MKRVLTAAAALVLAGFGVVPLMKEMKDTAPT
jgi:hypothetical protein